MQARGVSDGIWPRFSRIETNEHEFLLKAKTEIAAQFTTVSGPAISQHLKVLRDAQLVSVRRDGTRRLCKARPESLAEVRHYLESFWTDGLQRLKQAAEHEEKRKAYRARQRLHRP